MSILGAYILPHGALSLNPGKHPEYPELMEIYKSCNQIAEEIYSLKPELIFITTPHGISMLKSYGIYFNSQASGTAEWGNDYKDYTAKVDLSEEDSKGLFNALQEKNKYNIEGIVSYAEAESLPLRWGEVIPLWFLQQPYKNKTMIEEKFPKCMIMSMPRKRIEEAELMINECLDLGNDICQFFLNSNKKIVIVISGDLAHTHKLPLKLDSPLNLPVNIDDADIYDKSIEKWANDPLKNEHCLIDMGKFIKIYLSCGFTGFLILHGILQQLNNRSFVIKGSVLCNYHPTYYGMMAVRFEIK